VEDGISAIIGAMEKGKGEFDSFIWVLGDLFKQGGKEEEALKEYNKYLEKYPADYTVMEKKMEVLIALGRLEEAHLVEQEIESLFDFKEQ
ncbi:MAG: hypothetical protein WC322_06985, partial [Candidatus Paceibacterota bacterium]